MKFLLPSVFSLPCLSAEFSPSCKVLTKGSLLCVYSLMVLTALGYRCLCVDLTSLRNCKCLERNCTVKGNHLLSLKHLAHSDNLIRYCYRICKWRENLRMERSVIFRKIILLITGRPLGNYCMATTEEK